MSLWLLEAKAFPQDARSEEAKKTKYWLQPGRYTIGRAGGQVDVGIAEDKSISRLHAHINVPQLKNLASGEAPYIVIKDCSSHGTVASPSNDLGNCERIQEVKVMDRWYIKFGQKSPFRLYLQHYELYFPRSSAAPATPLEEASAAAEAAGMDVVCHLPSASSQRAPPLVVSLGAELTVDSQVALALLLGCPAVHVSWLLEWQEKRVWNNGRPQEGAHHSFRLAAKHVSGTSRPLARTWAALAAELAALAGRRPLEGQVFLWLGVEQDAPLQSVIQLLGGTNQPASSSQAAAAAAVAMTTPSDSGASALSSDGLAAAGAGGVRPGRVLVRTSEDLPGGGAGNLAAELAALSWTTPQRLLCAMLDGGGSFADAFLPGRPLATTPPPAATAATKRGRRWRTVADEGEGVVVGSPPSTRRRTRAQVAAGGSDTDATEESQPPSTRGRKRRLVLAVDDDDSGPEEPAAAPQATASRDGGRGGSAAAGDHKASLTERSSGGGLRGGAVLRGPCAEAGEGTGAAGPFTGGEERSQARRQRGRQGLVGRMAKRRRRLGASGSSDEHGDDDEVKGGPVALQQGRGGNLSDGSPASAPAQRPAPSAPGGGPLGRPGGRKHRVVPSLAASNGNVAGAELAVEDTLAPQGQQQRVARVVGRVRVGVGRDSSADASLRLPSSSPQTQGAPCVEEQGEQQTPGDPAACGSLGVGGGEGEGHVCGGGEREEPRQEGEAEGAAGGAK